jgi:hypothetical protein
VNDSHSSTRDRAVAPALCVLEFTYLLIRQSPVLTTGLSWARPALPDRGPGAATRARQTKPIGPGRRLAPPDSRDPRIRRDHRQGFGPWRCHPSAPNEPNFTVFRADNAVRMRNEASLWTGGLRLGISDCGLGIRGGGGVECEGVKCQTNPISPFPGLKMRVRMKTKPIFGREACDSGFRIAGWGFVEVRMAVTARSKGPDRSPARQTNPISLFSGLKTGAAALERQFDRDRRLGARVDER